MDIVNLYIEKRLMELDDMAMVYDEAGQDIPVDIIARRHELERLQYKLDEYKEVQEATNLSDE